MARRHRERLGGRMLRAVWIGVLLVGCSGGGDAPGEGEGGSRAARAPVAVVEVATVALGSVADTLGATAVVESEASADLMPVNPGLVREVRRDVGDRVQKDEVLAVLDNVQLSGGAERATAEADRLAQQLSVLRGLASQGAVSQREVQDLEYQLATARSQAREATRSYGQTRIVAPFDGVVARREVRVGELASSAAVAFQVVDLTKLRVVASLPERDVARIQPGQPVQLASAYDPDRTTGGSVARVSPVIDATSGTFQVVIAVDPDQEALRPGQFVSVSIEVDRRDGVIVVPRQALLYEEGAPIVFAVVEPDETAKDDAKKPEEAETPWWAAWFGGGSAGEAPGKEGKKDAEDAKEGDKEPAGPALVARRRTLELGLTETDHVQVLKGVEPGDRVVITGQATLKEGASVRVATPDREARLRSATEPASP